jgi:hypothetical protein
MNRVCRHVKGWIGVVLLAAWPAVAQESMVFTKPADLPTDKANDFLGDQHHDLGLYGSSAPLFGGKPKADFDILPGAQKPTPLSPAEIRQWQKFLDDKKNWTLMTPEEILGIPTPEQIMGLPDPNHEENMSATERYIHRQERQQNLSATNAMTQTDYFKKDDGSPFQWQNSDTENDPQRSRTERLAGAYQSPDGAQSPLSGTDPNRDADSTWHSAFTFAPPPPKPDPQQVASMENFRALLEPVAPEKPAAPSGFSPAPAPAPDPYLQPMPAFNPAGRSFIPVSDTAGRPMGINPLPTITGQTPMQSAPKPKPLVKLPPWLSTEPDLTRPPQGKF